MSDASDRSLARGIAVVGMAGRFPGADDPEAFWRNLREGVESIRGFSRRELEEAGIPRRILDDPRYVPMSGALDDIELFDADFFGFSPRDAEILDPQHRLFLEVCWQALEDAGHDAASFDGAIGVFGGCGSSDYLFHNLLAHPELSASAEAHQLRVYNSPDFLASLVAYKLGLTGPSVTVQSACSTALVAVCLACQSLLSRQCDAALAGGVSLAVPAHGGYLATESVMSPDGRCRAFGAAARGTVSGAGGGVVVLRRLADAVADGDRVLAVIRGFATNNDGAYKSSFTAPSVDGQMEVVAMAQAMAGISPDSITYVEAHGTGTPLGDPIEVAALTEAFALGTSRRGFCGLGSVKSQIGHLDAAAGIAGLIKTVQAMRHRFLPPSLHCEELNPQIDFAASPFEMVTEGRSWEPPPGTPRRAGVSAFGLGGVNAHVVLEEAPSIPETTAEITPEIKPEIKLEPPRLLLVWSAASDGARETLTDRLTSHLESHPDEPLSDVAFTAQVGRRMLPFRRALVCRDRAEALAILGERDPRRLLDGVGPVEEKPLAFLFPGLGHHYPGMAAELYRQLPAFSEPFDRCAAVLEPLLGTDPRRLLLDAAPSAETEPGLDLRRLVGRGASSPVLETRLSQPLVFAVELALAELLSELGLMPQAMLGFSIGEYVAACLAGVLSWDDALTLVARRAQLIATLPPGAMLAVPLAEERARELLVPEISLAAVNGPEASVVAGETAAIAELEKRLVEDGMVCRRLATEHAFHSPMMEPIVPRFRELVASLELLPPEVPYLSNVTGDWIRDEEATDPDYWVEHLLSPVRFGDGVGELWREGGRVLVEVGPGQTLSSWALQHPAAAELTAPLVLPTLRHDYDRQHDLGFLLSSLGRLWLAGQPIAWPSLWRGQARRRVALPTYPFERRRYWVDPPTEAVAAPPAQRDVAIVKPAAEIFEADAVVPAMPSTRSAGAYPRPALAVPYVAPRNAVEERLVAVFREVLRLEQVGILDSFFDLGGDSLQATSLLGRVRQTFGQEVSLRAMFESPAVVDLAALLRGAADEPSLPELDQQDLAVDERLPPLEPLPRPLDPGGQVLSFAQKRLWFLAELEPEHAGYNHPLVFELQGALDVGAWIGSLAEIVRRHEVLRTAFLRPPEAAEPVQRVAATAAVELAEVDLSALDEASREREMERGARRESRRPFVLARGALFRPRLFRLGEERNVALLLLHHIVADGWSMGILAREIEALYRAAVLGQPSPLPSLPVQYVDFAVWQDRWLSGEDLAGQLDYWRRQLADPPTLELPADRPRSARQRPGSRRRFFVDAPVVESLAELARGHEATLFMAVLAAFQAWLYRQTGETDLTVGTPVAGRRHPGSEGLIGFFVNTLVLRSRLRPRSSFRALLETARDTALAAHAHQDLPFERLVEELAPRRELERTPFFQVMLAWQSAPEARLDLPDLELRPLELWPEASLFELTLSPVRERDGCLHGYFEADGTFDVTTAERMMRQLVRLVAAVAVEPGRPVGELSLLGAAELQQLVVEPRWEIASLEAAHLRVACRAVEGGEAVALAWGDGEQLSYGGLDRRVRGLAGELVELGVGPEVRVGLCCERSAAEQVVALLAVLRAGGCVVPVDPSYPLERRRFMVADASLGLMVVSGSLSGGTVLKGSVLKYSGGTSSAQIDRSLSGGTSLKYSGGTLSAQIDRSYLGDTTPFSLDTLAYVLYTSGSTGRPKGVAVSHRVLANLVTWQLGDLTRPRRTLQLAPLSFDVSLQEILTTLAGGGQLTLVDEDTRRDPQALWRLLETARIERLFLPFVALQQLAEMRDGKIGRSALVELVTAGEALRATTAVRALCSHLGARLDNHYGPTETHAATAFRLPADPARWDALPAIGRPIAGGEALVLDGELRPRPLGVTGELFLGGAILARGYLDRPTETASRFMPHPLAAEPGRRLYRTGDLARWAVDGQLHFLGRADAQIKVRGFRIEPGEIEAALLALDDVAATAVVRRGEGATARLVAVVVPRPEAALSAEGLRAALGERLPEYLVPTSFVVSDHLPLLPSGKVDRRALSQTTLPATEPGRVPAATRHDDEEVVAGLFATLLELDGVGPEDDFFALGGHSLLATRLSSRLREVFGVELGVRTVFEAPTPSALAARLLAAKQAVTGRLAVPSLERRERPATLPLSFAQERLWFIEQLQSKSPLYNMPIVLRLAGHLDGALLEAVLREIGERHETLRTRFVTDAAGRPRQEITTGSDLVLRRVDLRALPEAVRLAEARRLARNEALLPFDLDRGPLWRAVMVIVAPQEHVLFLTLHHIISDGWSLGVLVREVAALYEARLTGTPSPLAPLSVGYGDYTLWQRGWLQGELLAQELGWWRRRLADLPPSLELPTDRPRPADRGWRGSSVMLYLPRQLMDGLRRLGREQGATLFMTLMAGFKALLLRWTGEDDIAVGTPIAGRKDLALESLIGFFVNTLVLRDRLARRRSFAELVLAVRRTALDAYAHQDVPFEKLVEELRPPRLLGQTPLFQVMLVLQNAPIPTLELPGLALRPFELDAVSAKFDLTLSLEEDPDQDGGLRGWLMYSSELFDRATVERFRTHFVTLLMSAVDESEQSLGELDVWSAAERHQVLVEATGPASVLAETRLERLLADQVARRSDRLAAVTAMGALSYGVLAGQAAALARRLEARGARPEAGVGISLPPGLELAIAVLAVARTGAFAVPLDPSYPAARLDFMLDDSGAELVVADSDDDGPIGEAASRRGVPLCAPRRASQKPAAGWTAIDGRHPLYVIYTSGSTGRPKGVALPRRAFVNLLAWHREARLVGVRTAQFAPLSFDASYHEIFAAWTTGGTLAPVDAALRRDVDGLARFLARERIEKATLPGLVLHQLAARDGAPPPWRSSLREVITSGELLTVTPGLRAWLGELASRASRPVPLHNQYGPSESHMVSAWTSSGDPTTWPERPPIGRAIPGATLHVVDAALRPSPIGVVGELAIGGVCLARGYAGRPDRTAARFVPSPLPAALPGSRLYRSGDLARRLADGRFDFVGRRDHQVKVHGVRLELGEIEACLVAQPTVRAAVATVRDDGAGRRLVAYAVSAGPSLDTAALRRRLAERLPQALVPAVIVELESLPRLPNGKIDRAALPAPEATVTVREAPRGAVEEALAELWRELLGCDVATLGRGDDFFALGGHSLLATQLVSRIRAIFGVELEVRALFTDARLAELARRVEEALAAGGVETPLPQIQPAPRDRPLPASFAQERLWFLDALMPQNPFYNLITAVELHGRLDRAAFAGAVGELVRRHEVLRTTFAPPATGKETPHQVIAAPGTVDVPVPFVELAGLPEATQCLAASAAILAQAVQPFDLERGPLLRLVLLRLGEERHTLVFALHHIITDGWSLGVMFRELAALYAAAVSGGASPLPPPRLQYADYALWQRGWLDEPDGLAQRDYWRRQLAELPAALELPADHLRPASPSFRGHSELVLLDAELRRRLETLASRHGATAAMVLLAAFELFLERLSGQDDFAVGMAIANRRRRELEELLGLFVNTLVIRASAGASLEERLASTRQTCLAAYAHQDLPFERLVEELSPRRELGRNPLVQVMFGYQNFPRPTLEVPGLTLVPPREMSDPGTSKFDLTLSLIEDGDGLKATFEADRELFDPTTIRRLGDGFARLLAAAANDPARPWAVLPWLAAAERHQLLVEWQGDRRAATDEPSLERLFTVRATVYPEAVAVVDAGTAATFAHLAERAAQLAGALHRRGLGPEKVVALHLEPSVELVAAILAVWRTGAAYLPLDPNHPSVRLAWQVSDSGAILVLTTQRSALGELAVEALSLDELDEDIPLMTEAAPFEASYLTYVIYTSGSTGRPKGVACAHLGLLNLLADVASRQPVGKDDAVSFWTRATFDVSLYELGIALRSGAVLHIVPDALRGDASSLFTWLASRRVTWAYVAPFLLAELERRVDEESGLALRHLLVGVEPIPESRLAAIAAGLPGLEILNGYGPAEATVCATFYPVPRDSTRSGRTPLGRALRGVAVHVLDTELEPVPSPGIGELCVAGVGLARAYLGRPGLTAERFVPDPHAVVPGERLYRTGDLGRWRVDGQLEFLGRRDHQVKLHGLRIELGEVEAVLAEHSAVEEAVALVRDGRLVAFFVGSGARFGSDNAVTLNTAAPNDLPWNHFDTNVRPQGGLSVKPGAGHAARSAAGEPQDSSPTSHRSEGAESQSHDRPAGCAPRGRVDLGDRQPGAHAASLRSASPAPGYTLAPRWGAEARGPGLAGGSDVLPAKLQVTAHLRAFLAERLPRAMVPAVIHQLDAWPLTAHGKLDRAALEQTALPTSTESRPPTSPAERALAVIWAEVLRRDAVSLHAEDDFFALGGHSLLAAQVAARIREVWGVELPLRVLFEEPVLAGLAARLGTPEAETDTFSVEVLPRPVEGNALFPLSFAQERLWFIDQLQPGSAAYNLPLSVELTGRLRPAVLAAAFSALVARHETLRTTFIRLNAGVSVDAGVWHGLEGRGKPGQRIAPPQAALLPVVDLRALPFSARRRESARLAREDARRPFELERGPLLRLALVRLGEESALLLMNLHHIVGDAWSMKVLLEELGVLYRAGAAGGTAVLPRLALQYADYAVWQRRFLDDARLADELAFWRDELRGAGELELPGDRPRPSLRSGSGASLVFAVDGELSTGLEALARQNGATLFMVLLATFESLLGRYGQQRDFTVGTPVAGRPLASAETLIGFFVNTLVLRSDLAASPPSFAALLELVRERTLAVLAHQELPFERLVEALQPRRDPGRTPLFNVLFSLQNVPLEPLELDDLHLEVLGVESGVARFDLSWAFTPTPRGLDARVTYNRDLFDATTVERLRRHLAALLAAVVVDPAAEPGSLSLFADYERHQLLVEWNDTAVRDEPSLLHRLFASRARERPDAVALIAERDPARIDGDATILSYGALHGLALELAGELRRRGVGPEALVAVAAQPSLEMVVGFLGILEAGGAYLPVEPSLPAARLAFILGDALRGRRPCLLLADEAFLATWGELTGGDVEPALAEVAASLEVLSLARTRVDAFPTGDDPERVEPLNLAYVIYTSGSTGRPKGVMCTHRGLVNRMRAEDPLSGDDAMLQRSSSTFDASLRELFWPLLRGARVYLASSAARRDPAMLLALVERQRLSVAGFVPTLLATVLRQPEEGRLRSLRQMISAGEALPVDVAREVRRRWPWIQLDNRYGPTETSIVVTGQRIDRVETHAPIGRPQRNSRVHLLDRQLDPVPIGVIGELCTSGVQLTRGYLARPGLTATVFVADPLAGEPGARLYRSGDLVRRLSDGTIDFVGRRDHQVKIRGFRIEPGEVETVLCRHPAVTAALVHLDESVGERRLVAYLVTRTTSSSALDTAELRRFLALRLPDYMVPGVYIALERLPVLPNGKVDRKALRELGEAGRLGSGREYAPPQSELERTLATIWAEVLGLERVGLHDGFFDLGGHSLQLVEVRTRIEEALERSFPLSELFNHATVASLARFLSTDEVDAASSALAEVEARQEQLGAGKDRRRDRLARRRLVAAELEGGEK